jgi:hypothetical protein
MRVARKWPELEAKAQHVALLPLREALDALADKRPAPAAEPWLGPDWVYLGGTRFYTPTAWILPPMSADLHRGIRESVEQIGFIVPIDVDGNNRVFDGRCRLIVAAEMGFYPVYVRDEPVPGKPNTFRLVPKPKADELPVRVNRTWDDWPDADFSGEGAAFNCQRKHLTPDERVWAESKYKPILERETDRIDRERFRRARLVDEAKRQRCLR